MKPRNLVIIAVFFVLVLFLGVYLGKNSNQPSPPAINEPVATNPNASQVPQPAEKPQVSLEEALSAELSEAEKQTAADMVVECYEIYYADQEKIRQESKALSASGKDAEALDYMSDYNIENRKLVKEKFVDPETRQYLESLGRGFSPITYPQDSSVWFVYLESTKAFGFQEAGERSDVFVSLARKDLARVIQEDGEEIKALLAEYHHLGYEKYAIVITEYRTIKVTNHYQWSEELSRDNTSVFNICGFKNNNWYIIPIQ